MITKDEFRTEATAFLDANAKRRVEVTQVWGQGSDEVSILPERTPEEDAAILAAAKEWRAKVFDAGFGWITGPEAYGGRGLTREYERAWQSLENDYDVPTLAPFGIGLGMVAPTILAHAIEDVRRQYLAPLYRGDIVACQLFSEPVAGSDLAGIQTKAIRDGDEWVLNGQKVWTSGAHYSDIGEIITRTSSYPDSRHRGLTMFLVDMRAPGVEVRPLRQMTGGASFNEVFFTDVRVPDEMRLGDVDQGWTVALTTLMNERMAIGGGGVGGGLNLANRLQALARHMGVADDPNVRQQLADVIIRHSVNRYTTLRAMAKMRAGQLPGPELSTLKLALTNNMQKMSELLTGLLGPRLIADTDEWGTYAWSAFVLSVPGLRVAGGTDEVLRNIVGERVLGLPKG
ncbi:MAG TPA: acyl-CoA dehydrogenase family protein [Acidimicrobiia bacterium]|jgi:alkylation response protein AidB-like acyl-CoA dehydrogenase|nr:acyl-CoA dehydrogenase family protein [Acidimicrobiia bacterium]